MHSGVKKGSLGLLSFDLGKLPFLIIIIWNSIIYHAIKQNL